MDFGYANISTAANKRIVQFVRSALERSGNMPLQIYIRSPDFGPTTGGSVLELLAQHSHRWKDASIWTERHSYQQVIKCLTSANGHFPLLERLLIDGVPVDHDLFQFSPRLMEPTLEGSIPENLKPNLPWNQLRSVTFNRLPGQDDIARAVLQLCRCPQITRLSFYRPRIPQKSVFAPTARDFPAVVSDIHSLAINFCHGLSPGFIKFLGCITLRRARVLLLKTEHTYHPVCWSQTAFLAFSTRSSLHDTLRVLKIFNLAISGDQLVECLAGLPRVEILSVSDPNPWDAVPDNRQLLINDDLLRALTWTSDTGLALVPQLHSSACDTFMQFKESSYVDFISSRIGPGRNADGPFESSILYSRGKGATVEAPLAKRLSVRLLQFVLRKELRSRIERDDLRSFSYVEESK
jgi:hypothetical protein